MRKVVRVALWWIALVSVFYLVVLMQLVKSVHYGDYERSLLMKGQILHQELKTRWHNDSSAYNARLLDFRDSSHWLEWYLLESGLSHHSPDDIFIRPRLASEVTIDPSDNLWVFARNLTAEMPDTLIFLATRNVSPAAFRLTLSENELDDAFPCVREPDGILKDYAVIYLKNGMKHVLSLRRKQKVTYRDIYGHAFSMTNTPGKPISYLFPTGEWFPADGTKQKTGK